MLSAYRKLLTSLISDAYANDRADMAAAFLVVRDMLDDEFLDAETVFAVLIGKRTLADVLAEVARGIVDDELADRDGLAVADACTVAAKTLTNF